MRLGFRRCFESLTGKSGSSCGGVANRAGSAGFTENASFSRVAVGSRLLKRSGCSDSLCIWVSEKRPQSVVCGHFALTEESAV